MLVALLSTPRCASSGATAHAQPAWSTPAPTTMKARTRGRSHHHARNPAALFSCVIRTSPGTPDTGKHTSPYRVRSTSTVISVLAGPLASSAGSNEYLGWATTNNAVDTDEVYALDVDPAKPDHYVFDGVSIPLQRVLLTAEYRNGPGISTVTREFWSTPLGPVAERANGKVYVLRAAGEGDYRNG